MPSFEEYVKNKRRKNNSGRNTGNKQSFEDFARARREERESKGKIPTGTTPSIDAPMREDVRGVTESAIQAAMDHRPKLVGGKERTWFQDSIYADEWFDGGAQKAAFATGVKLTEKVAQGIIGMPEKMVDGVVMTIGQGINKAADAYYVGEYLKGRISGEDKETASDNAGEIRDLIRDYGVDTATDFVTKDLYDEEEIAHKYITEDFEFKTGKLAEWGLLDEAIDVDEGTITGAKTDDLAVSVGEMIPNIILGIVAPYAVPAVTATKVMGSTAEEELNSGESFDTAFAVGAVDAVAETLSEYLFSGIKFGGKTVDDLVADPLIQGISNKVVKTAVRMGVDIFGEGAEEWLSEIVSQVGEAIIKDEDLVEAITSDEARDARRESFIGGMALGGISSVGKTTSSTVQGKDPVTGLNKSEQAVVDKAVDEEVARREANGKKVSLRERGKLVQEMIENLDKGNFSIDAIEEVLGGDSYKAYKDVADREDAIRKEFEELGKKTNPTLAEQDRYAELKQQLEDIKKNSKKGELKDKVSREVYNLVKDTRISESYNQRAKRGKAFEADLSQYSEKQRAVVQKAIDSGVLNDTNKTHMLVDWCARVYEDKGIEVDFVNNEKLRESGFVLEGKQVNGVVAEDGSIKLNVESNKMLESVVGHEVTHVFEGTEMYDALAEIAVNYAKTKGEYDTRLEALNKLYKGVYKGDDFNDKIQKELVADLVGDYLFTDSKFINTLCTDKPKLFRKILDEIEYLCKVATAGSKEARELEKLKKAFKDVWRESGKVNNAASSNDIKYSLSNENIDKNQNFVYNANRGERYAKTDDFRDLQTECQGMSDEDTQLYWSGSRQINDEIRGRFSRSVKQVFLVSDNNGRSNDSRLLNFSAKGNQFNIYEDVDASLFRDVFEMARKHLQYGELVDLHKIETTEDGIGYDDCCNYLSEDGLSGFSITPDGDLISVFNASGRAGFLRAISPFVKENVKTLDCFISPKQNLQKMYEDIFGFKTASVMDNNPLFDHDNIKDNHESPKVAFMVNTDADVEVRAFTKDEYNEAAAYRNSFINQAGSSGSAFSNGENTKYSLSDSEGRELSTQQSEYFKDSKVRDAYGRLKVMHHGSPETFTVFDKKKARSSGTYGSGFYFTDSESHAGTYGDSYDVYLNITNPLQNGTNDITKDQLRKFVEAIAEDEDYGIENYGYGATIDSVTDSVYGKSDFGMLMDLNISCVGNMVQAVELFNEVNGTDYNGIIVPTETVAFYPNQIKNIDNLIPTENEDIRYSLSEEGGLPTRSHNGTYGEDIRLVKNDMFPTKAELQSTANVIPNGAPLTEVVAKNATSTLDDIPIRKDIAPIRPVETTKPIPEISAPIREMNPKAEQRKNERIVGESQVRGDEAKAKKKNKVWSSAVRNFVSKGAVFETLALKTKNRALQDKYKMWRDRSESKAQYFMENGKGNIKSLKDIRNEVRKAGLELDFDLYMKHRHNVDRMKYDKPVFGSDVTADVSRQTAKQLEAAHPEFKRWAQDVYNINNHLRQMMVDGGLITQETADFWARKYPNYIPIERVSTEEKSHRGGKGTGISAPIKRATGGDSLMENLFITMAHRTSQTFKAIDKNNFGLELKKTLGVGGENADTNLDEIIDGIGTEKGWLNEGEDGKNPTFTILENGKRVTFEITDEMYEALKPTSEAMSRTFKIPNALSKAHKKVLTEYNLFFTARNIVKDSQDVLINSKHPAMTYANMPKAMKELLTNGKYATEYWENGGESNSYFDSNTDVFAKERSKFRKVIGIPSHISRVNDFVEAIPRLAEYIASRRKGATIEAAMTDAARVTTDFADGGDITKFANRNGATFLNASVQGAAQQVRNIREAKAEGLKGVLKLAGKYAVAGIPVLIFNALMWDDDEEYEELSDYVKDNYYIITQLEDGTFVRIPKGRTVAVIQEVFEQIANTVKGEESDWGNIFELAVSNLAPNNPLENNILAPIVQATTNKTWYGDDLVPERLQDVPAREQYDETIDSLSKWLGENTGVSPYKIHYVLDQYSGFVGDMILPMLTPEAERGNNSLLAPLADQFTTDSTMKNQNISDFYDVKDELTVNANSSMATDEDILMSKYFNAINSDIGELYAQKREIQGSTLPDDAKYTRVYSIQGEINALAEEALEDYEDVEIKGKYATVGGMEFRLDDDGKWQKISDDQLELQEEVTEAFDITPSQYWGNKQEYDFMYKYPEKYAVLQEQGISVEEYKENYEESVFMYTDDFAWASDNPGKYAVSKVITDDVMEYKHYTSVIADIEADYDRNGNPISGSKKEKIIDYINSLDIDRGQAIILYKSVYDADDTYNDYIVDYLNSRDDISREEMITILEELGATVDSRGKVWW